MRRLILSLAAVLVTFLPARAAEPPADPLNSPMWEQRAREFLPDGKIVFDPRVRVTVVPLAEDPATVPVSVDATALGEVTQIVVFADYSPIPHVLTYMPVAARPTLAFHFKVEQSTAVRVAALTRDGVWHVGSAEITATGGGCTMPARAHSEEDWYSRLMQVRARIWRHNRSDSRLRVRIQHPMDTGLAPGIPAFFIETVEISTPGGEVLGKLELHEPVSENPMLTLEPEVPPGIDNLRVTGRDNNGNVFSVEVPAPVRASAAPQGKDG